jgi:hypothetical protein
MRTEAPRVPNRDANRQGTAETAGRRNARYRASRRVGASVITQAAGRGPVLSSSPSTEKAVSQP